MILADIFNMRYKDDLIDFKYVELDFEDIRSSKIYYEYKTFEKSRIKRIVKIEFKGLFSNYRMKVNNQCYTKTQLFNENSVSNYIYFCIDDQTRESKKLRFIIEKDDEEDNKTYILTVYFQIEKKDNNLIISNYKIVSLRRVYNLFFKDGIEEKVTPQKILSTLKYCYKYNYQYDIAEELKLKTTHDSSWLFHNGSYGSGKSSLDLLSTLESGYTLVIISPWENNYDVDFLYLVYQKTKLCCIGRGLITNILTSIKRPTNIIFYTTIFSISTLIYELFGEFIVHLLTLGYNAIKHDKMIIDIKELMGEIIGSLDSITLKDSLTFFSFIIILLSVWFIVRIFLAEIIIHFKDSTKIHQFYYIDRILNTIRDYNLFLIIEDVDRMPKEGIEDVLRVISCLNREYTNCSRALGIISLDKENLIGEENSTFKEKEFEDLRNKVFSKEIFSGYDVRASMTKYLKEYCKVAYDLFDMESETDININRKKILGLFKNEPIHNFRINGNFRNIHEVINMLIYDDYWTMENMKSKIDEFIEIPIATWNSYNS